MKTFISFLQALLAAAAMTTNAQAQVFRVLHEFSDSSWSTGMTNWDGAQPYNTGLALAGNTVYGTTYYGGPNGNGVVFSVNTDASGFTVLHTFSRSYPPSYTNADGEYPQGSLAFSGGTLYGTTLNGGTNSGGYGTIYSVKTNGNSFTCLHSFDLANGSNPNGPLVIADNRIYGTAAGGGAGGYGVVFGMNLDGTDFAVLHAFTNIDGHYPNGVVLSGDTLYGSAYLGGSNGFGTIFSIKTNGTGFAVLHTFSAGNAGYYHQFNDDGKEPEMPVVIEGNTIYGTAVFGGYYGRGTLFSLKTDGTGFTVLRTFADNNPLDERPYQDGGGAYPMGLSVSNGVLYGVAESGGGNDTGTVYTINTNGADFTVLYRFSPANSQTFWTNFDGGYPEGAPVLSGNALYGTAEQAGTGNGTVFRLMIQPSITSITLSGSDLILHGWNGVDNESCVTLASSSLALPLADWTPVATNTLSSGRFTIAATNAIDPMASARFFALRLQ